MKENVVELVHRWVDQQNGLENQELSSCTCEYLIYDNSSYAEHWENHCLFINCVLGHLSIHKEKH